MGIVSFWHKFFGDAPVSLARARRRAGEGPVARSLLFVRCRWRREFLPCFLLDSQQLPLVIIGQRGGNRAVLAHDEINERRGFVAGLNEAIRPKTQYAT
jgi:hypothetical protein